MRTEFVQAMLDLHRERGDLVFVTVDLGYMAVEQIAAVFGQRFINAGVAEQNAVSLAAGLARAGELPWVYSMSAFLTLRPYAQIRDNICLHRLPVKLVGNGGGYGYGIMGATHHALQDMAAMRALPDLRIYVPLVNGDVAQVVRRMATDPLPNYLRLNSDRAVPFEVGPFAPFRKLKPGRSCVVLGIGPVLLGLWDAGVHELLDELEIWCVGTMPLEQLPAELLESIEAKGKVVTIEEHCVAGGLGEALAHRLLSEGALVRSFSSISAAGYPSGRYGSQHFHQRESGLSGPSLVARLEKILSD